MSKRLFVYLLAVLFPFAGAAWADVTINATNFPDENFRVYVSDTLDTDGNGSLSDAEIAEVEEIDVGGKGITDLTGIAFFTALESLYCNSNGLTTLDVSSLTQLTALDCHNNVLTTLDVPGLDRLRLLHCYNNLLTELDVSYCTSLRYLSCRDNLIEDLYVNGCTALESLSCGNNRVEYLDVSDCTALETLTCYSNRISMLDVSGCVNLKSLNCRNNQLTALDLSGEHPKLETPSLTQTISGMAEAILTTDVTYPYQLDLDDNTGVNVADIARIVSVDG
ncbi:MAG: hypothetical protein K6E38_06005, partial [Fretibacterium sp.]|nr:hypothetical protein [Fretibacterium sp.]